MGTPANRPRIKAIGFDFDHTLGIDNKLERIAFLRLLEPRRALIDEIETIDELLAEQRSGLFSIEEAVRRFVCARGVDPGDAASYVERYKRTCVDMVDELVICEPGVRTLCAELQARAIPAAILTNGWSPLQQRKAQHVGFAGEVVVSADIGVQKPQLRAFEALSSALGVRLDETAFVGDTPESDVAGALAAGMFAVWYDTERKAYPPGVTAPSAVIHSLAELLSLV